MLSFSFYLDNGEEEEIVDIPDELYQWLTHSEFSKIGQSEERDVKIDGEITKIAVVPLMGSNRRKLSNFFRDAIVQESDRMLNQLSHSSSKEDYLAVSYTLRILQNLRKLIEDEQFKYLSRI